MTATDKAPRRLTKHQARQRRDQIKARLDSGMKAARIAQDLGLSVGRLYAVIRDDPGLNLPASPGRVCVRVGKIGNLTSAVDAQSEEFQDWLRDSLPAGGTIADFAISCAVDAFHEER